MKCVCAIVPEGSFDGVNAALHKIGVAGLTACGGRGRGRQRPDPNRMGHWFYFAEFGDNTTVTVLCSDADAPGVAEAIRGSAGAGKIFTIPVDDLVDARTGARGEAAL